MWVETTIWLNRRQIIINFGGGYKKVFMATYILNTLHKYLSLKVTSNWMQMENKVQYTLSQDT